MKQNVFPTLASMFVPLYTCLSHVVLKEAKSVFFFFFARVRRDSWGTQFLAQLSQRFTKTIKFTHVLHAQTFSHTICDLSNVNMNSNVYKTVVRAAMMYGLQTVALKK